MSKINFSCLASPENQEVLEAMFFKGASLKDVKNIDDSMMEKVYSVAFDLYETNRFDESAKVFRTLCAIDPYSKRYFMGLAACLQMLKQYEQAVEIYTVCYLFDSEDPTIPLQAAYCHMMMKHHAEAKSGFKMALLLAGDKSEFVAEREKANSMLRILDMKANNKDVK